MEQSFHERRLRQGILKKIREDEDRLRLEQAPLLNDLRAVGITVDDVWTLVNHALDYRPAVPILVDHLQRPYHERIREGIARALAVPFARDAWPVLLRLFRESSEQVASGVKGAVGLALSVIARGDQINDLAILLEDPAHRQSRTFLIEPLMRSRKLEHRQLMESLAGAPVVGPEIRRRLRRRKNAKRR